MSKPQKSSSKNTSKLRSKRLDCKTVRIFAYSSTREESNKRCGTRLKTESGRVRLARFAHKTLTPRVTDFFTDFEEKTDCFAVYKRSTSLNSMVQFLLLMLRTMNELTGSPGDTVKVRYMYHSWSQE